jgi:flagellar protein FlgJ
MTLSPIQNLTIRQQGADAQPATAARATGAAGAATAEATPEQRKVAEQFEAMFMRQLLGSMEKGSGFGGSGPGAGVYRSMMVGALADSSAAGGGIGLAEVVLEALLQRPELSAAAKAKAQGQTAPSPSTAPSQNVLNRGDGAGHAPFDLAAAAKLPGP